MCVISAHPREVWTLDDNLSFADMNGNYDRNEPIVLFRTPEQLEKVPNSVR